MQALKEKSYLSELHKVLDKKSKCTRFTDIIALHPSTSVHYSVKEKVACLVSEWYNEYLDTQLIEINDTHKRDYPLTVLLPLVLECISNSEIVAIKYDNEETSDYELITNPDAFKGCSCSFNSDMENLCPKWKGEYNNILHLNTSLLTI